jgi:hypothetical protein
MSLCILILILLEVNYFSNNSPQKKLLQQLCVNVPLVWYDLHGCVSLENFTVGLISSRCMLILMFVVRGKESNSLILCDSHGPNCLEQLVLSLLSKHSRLRWCWPGLTLASCTLGWW